MSQPYTLRHIAEHYPGLNPRWVSEQLRRRTFVSRERKYLYCEVPKAGCTFLKTLIHTVERLPPIKPLVGPQRETRREMFIHDRGRFGLPSLLDLDDSDQEQFLTSPNIFRFTVVRNPYSRLQSAWRDKIQTCEPSYAYVCRAIKGELPRAGDPASCVSFAEFVEYIAKENRSNCDHHWLLQSTAIFFPALRFTHIGRLEDLDRVLDLFLEHVGRADLARTGALNRSAPALIPYSPELARRVHELYRPDFVAFDYAEDSWQMPADSSHDPTQPAALRSVREARYLDEVIERNIVIAQLYDIRDALNERSRVQDEAVLERYAQRSFDDLYDKYISSMDGWLSRDEAQLLYESAKSAKGGCIVEIGSFRGRSTCVLAFGALAGACRPVFAIDPHEPFVGAFGGRFGPIDRGHFMRRMVELGLYHLVRLVNLGAEYLSDQWPLPVELLWIDADHRYEAVMEYVQHWSSRLTDDATVIIANAADRASGPGRVVGELLGNGTFERLTTVGKVVHLRRLSRLRAEVNTQAPAVEPDTTAVEPDTTPEPKTAPQIPPQLMQVIEKCVDALWLRAMADDIKPGEIAALMAGGDVLALARQGRL